jgi:6-phosphogluconolactonase/glucosamine-6-phosphate isomerase/deaminase
MKIVQSDHPVSAAAEHLADVIKKHLGNDERVLWLLSGGSGIKVVLETTQLLQGIDLSKLSVTLSDERYGSVGHSDENWKQLLDNDFSLPGANTYRPLTGDDRRTATQKFSLWLMQQTTSADYRIGLFGIGNDGHTAGIKPHSSATQASEWADDYTGDDFERITMTPFAITRLDEVVIQAAGDDKLPTLKKLRDTATSVDDQPAQILKNVPNGTLYTNIKEL